MAGTNERRAARMLRRNQRLRMWIAFVLSLFAPGLGHVFLGYTRLGLLFYALFLTGLAVGLASFLLVPAGPVNVIFAFAVWLPCFLGPAFHAANKIRQSGVIVELGEVRWLPVGIGVLAAVLIGNTYNFFVRTVVAEAVKADSRSMEPSILVGDRVMVNKLSYTFSEIERGDVVALHVEDAAQPDIVFKRVIGLPGETVELRDNTLYIEGIALETTWARPETTDQDDIPETRVPDDHLFVLGDRRARSQDSRSWGAVPTESLMGKASRLSVSVDPDAGKVRWSRLGSIIR